MVDPRTSVLLMRSEAVLIGMTKHIHSFRLASLKAYSNSMEIFAEVICKFCKENGISPASLNAMKLHVQINSRRGRQRKINFFQMFEEL